MINYSLFVFDFDYTLGDTTSAIVDSVNYGLVNLNHKAHSVEEIKPAIGLTLRETYYMLTNVTPSDEEEKKVALFYEYFMENANKCMTKSARLYDATIPVLQAIKDAGGKTAIVTTKAKFRIEEILARFNISHLVDVVVGSDIVKNPKPDPESVNMVLSELCIAPQDAVYIGDSLTDAKTASSSGLDFIGVLTGTTAREALEAYPSAIKIFNDLGELYDEYLA